MKCPVCDNEDVMPVWENLSDYEQNKKPDHYGCTNCSTMTKIEDSNNDILIENAKRFDKLHYAMRMVHPKGAPSARKLGFKYRKLARDNV